MKDSVARNDCLLFQSKMNLCTALIVVPEANPDVKNLEVASGQPPVTSHEYPDVVIQR